MLCPVYKQNSECILTQCSLHLILTWARHRPETARVHSYFTHASVRSMHASSYLDVLPRSTAVANCTGVVTEAGSLQQQISNCQQQRLQWLLKQEVCNNKFQTVNSCSYYGYGSRESTRAHFKLSTVAVTMVTEAGGRQQHISNSQQ